MIEVRHKKSRILEMKIPLYFFIAILVFPFYIHSETRFVSKTGTSIPPYVTPETAADSIQKCINVCNDGDTVYVGNGVYHESLVLNKVIWLIGTSMDSTVIDGTGLAQYTITIPSSVLSLHLKDFTILGKGNLSGTAVFSYNNIDISHCRLKQCRTGVDVEGGIVDNLLIRDVIYGITGFSVLDTAHFLIKNNIITLSSPNQFAAIKAMGGYHRIYNNIAIFYGGNGDIGIYTALTHSFDIRNNLVSGFGDGIVCDAIDSSIAANNVLVRNNFGVSFNSSKIKVLNCILKRNAYAFTSPVSSNTSFVDYNIIWDNYRNYDGPMTIGDSNKIADPMVMSENLPDTTFNFDFHLQKYSPCIDKGDPSILDLDGSRSDCGLFGGNWGETYEYKDLAPMPPKNFTATVTSGQILFKWKKNTEADTAYYNLYMDSTQNFTIDSTKLLATTADTLFTYLSLQSNKAYYFKITATDKQGNESLPSEELYIFINVTGEEYPIEISSYQLYNNYPNPFNPSTKISYKLKESGYVKLLIYDIKGELIKVLVNKEQESGFYETEFDAINLASGIYIYRLEVIGKENIPVYSEMKKALLIK